MIQVADGPSCSRERHARGERLVAVLDKAFEGYERIAASAGLGAAHPLPVPRPSLPSVRQHFPRAVQLLLRHVPVPASHLVEIREEFLELLLVEDAVVVRIVPLPQAAQDVGGDPPR